MAGRSIGRMTRISVPNECEPSVSEASSRLRSIWLRLARPARMPTGMLRKAKAIAMIVPVPVSDTGGTLNARM